MPRRPKSLTIKRPRKRLDQLPVETPLVDAVAMILRQRLDGVLYYLPYVAERAEENVEFVHQLRVAARRSTAALDAFQPLLPRKRTRQLRRELRKLRKALGEARDLDVMTLRLGGEAARQSSKRLRRVVRILKSKRIAEQENVVSACVMTAEARLAKTIRRLLKRVRWHGKDNEPSLLRFNAELLREAVDQFFSQAETSSHDPLILHEARIEAKRLRYTLELVEPVLTKSAGRKPRKWFAQLQESLGRISDHAAASELFDHWADDSQTAPTLRQLAASEREQLDRAIADFHSDWTPKRLGTLREWLVNLASSIDDVTR